MKKEVENIHPIFHQLLQRTDRVTLLQQNSFVLWMTGLSGSGKSTIAKGLEKKLYAEGYLSYILDGDNIRFGINKDLGFSVEDRKENIRRIAEISKLFVDAGIITINSFVSPTLEIRQQAKDIIGEKDFIEVYINAPFEVCAQRDVKGLYKKALAGEIKNFTGLDAPFEAPVHPAIEIKTDNLSVEESVDKIFNLIIQRINL
ncbi:MAG: adenylyl-sulfate kinase [Chitinophagales bacterium]|nr:adenylyl-sulfate kinase [Chitinophagales bacterium]